MILEPGQFRTPPAAKRFGNTRAARWDPEARQRTRSPEEAERVLLATGRMTRPLRLADVKSYGPPLVKTIVANAKERRIAAELTNVYTVGSLTAKCIFRRETHPVWQHDRILMFAKMQAKWLQPCSWSNEPVEMEMPLKFKAIFREDADPWMPTMTQRWEDEMERRDLRLDIIEGRKMEKAFESLTSPDEMPENVFGDALLDNVLDVGEVVLQHFFCFVDRTMNDDGTVSNFRYHKRLAKRLSKELGTNITFGMKALDERGERPSAQEKYDNNLGLMRWKRWEKQKQKRERL